jgi:hypothetical protein
LPGRDVGEELDFGDLVWVVEIVDWMLLAKVKGDPFAVGPWCWLLARARRMRPVPFKGQADLLNACSINL